MSEFGRVCERRKLRVNVGKSKVMRCSRYGNGDRMPAILNGEPLEEVDCFKYLGSQVAADGGCERDAVYRMNEGYRAWGALKSVLSNKGLGMKAKKCLYEGVIVTTITCATMRKSCCLARQCAKDRKEWRALVHM